MTVTANNVKSDKHDTGTRIACPCGTYCYVLEIGSYYDAADITRIFSDETTAKAQIPKGFNEQPKVTAFCYYGHNESRGKWASIKKYEVE